MAEIYTTADAVAAGYRTLTADEITLCTRLIIEAGVIVDAYNEDADEDVKGVVVCQMVRRAISSGNATAGIPMGAMQGTMTAGPYSQSWTVQNGSVGELYLSKLDKKLLGVGNRIGSRSPAEWLGRKGCR